VRKRIISTLETKEMNMRNPMALLVLWLAELLDRSLIEVPDLDDLQMPSPARSATALKGQGTAFGG
jgi:hypothetical protein